MRYIKFAISLLATVVIFFVLQFKMGSVPPLGKFLNPAGGFWQNEKEEIISGTVTIEGLSDKITVHYDEFLIPHVFAETDEDLYKAQGYITAKHRLWQMEFQTMAAAGRLSEIIGEKALEYDRQMRRIGMGFGAENAIGYMSKHPDSKRFLEAYCDGVNSYIDQLKCKDFPVEYKLLDYAPENWTIEKTAYLLMYMTRNLTGSDWDLEYTNALQKFGKDRFDLLYPDFFDVTDPVIPKETDWSFIETETPSAPASPMISDSTKETVDKPHPRNGSNNWAVSGDRSVTGNPILANDPHLGLNLPSIWYVMQLSTPEYNTMGATLPGALGVISGFNNKIAWGVTNATRDVQDWYKIKFRDNKRTHYWYNNSWRETSQRIEEIAIRGKKPFTDTIIYTHHGPVTYDHNFKGTGDKVGYALKWIGHRGGDNQRTFLELNRAKNYQDYLEALKHYVAPAQNFVFASTEGDIALWVQGKFPNKWKGQGKFLMDGSNPDHDWQSFIPQEFNAHTKNPARGFVSSANQHPTDESYPFYVFNDNYESYRNRIINEYFRSRELFSIRDFKDLQNNNYNLKAAEILPSMLESLEAQNLTQEELEIANLLREWDFYNEADQTAPSIWTNWWRTLFLMIWDEIEDEELKLRYPFEYQTIYLLINQPNNVFMDIIATEETETAGDLILKSFKESAEQLNKWEAVNGEYNWAKYKATYVGHLLQALPAFSRLNIPVGGDGNSVNAISKNHGPSWRMIVEMSDPPKALGVYPGGQSGNPGSKHYEDYIDNWIAGEYLDLHFLQSKQQTDNIKNTQYLTPKP